MPPIIPVYGEEGKIRKTTTKVSTIPEKCIVTVYEAGDEFVETDPREDFGDDSIRISVDVYHAFSKERCWKLYRELRRCLSQSKTSPGGNYSLIKFAGRQDLSNRKQGFFRLVQDIYLVKVADFIGHQ